MSLLGRVAVTLRRLLVRRPWIYWAFVVLAALGAAASMLDRSDRVDAARAAWGADTTVFVATHPLAPGDPIEAESRRVPVAMVADGAIDDPRGLTARQHVAAGEVINEVDVTSGRGPQAMTPPGWLAVPVVESPASGAVLGDRVRVVSDGIVVSADARIVGLTGDATIVAVPADEAPTVAAVADHLTLLLVP